MPHTTIPVLIIFAPTACGKTALVNNLFGKSSLSAFTGLFEAISADSQAVYTCMDIGTAKPSAQERSEIPYHAVDLVPPSKQFGVGDFLQTVDADCASIFSRGRIPLLVGGSAFYIRTFILGLPSTPESRPEIRDLMRRRLESEGLENLYAELLAVDEQSAARINPNDAYRICRALEVYHSCGAPLSSFAVKSAPRDGYDFCTIILMRDRNELFERIDRRVDDMFDRGLEREVERLVAMGYGPDSPGMKAIGYSEFFIPGLKGEELRQRIKTDSRRYAKKQYTFMRGIPGAVTVDADDMDAVSSVVSSFIGRLGRRQ